MNGSSSPNGLQALVKSGRLIETGRDRYTLAEHAAAHQNLIAGRLTMHRDGYGFVIPNPDQRSSFSGDIYINPQAIGSAMHGDQVLVELGRKRDTPGRARRFCACGVTTAVPKAASCACSLAGIPPWSAPFTMARARTT